MKTRPKSLDEQIILARQKLVLSAQQALLVKIKKDKVDGPALWDIITMGLAEFGVFPYHPRGKKTGAQI